MASPARAGTMSTKEYFSNTRTSADVAGRELELLREERGEVPRVDAPVSPDTDEELGEVPSPRRLTLWLWRCPSRAGPPVWLSAARPAR